MNHFNKLTPAEAERLALLTEELGEVQQVLGKILRHGFDSSNPLDPEAETNRRLLEKELGHVQHAVKRLCVAKDIERERIDASEKHKAPRIHRWLHHQAD